MCNVVMGDSWHHEPAMVGGLFISFLHEHGRILIRFVVDIALFSIMNQN